MPDRLLLALFCDHFTALKRCYGEGYRRTFFRYLVQMLAYFALLFRALLSVLAILTPATV